MTGFFPKKNYIMGYNLENVRNGKSACDGLAAKGLLALA